MGKHYFINGLVAVLLCTMAICVQAQIPTPLRAKFIAAGNGHACAITNEGAAKCWGDGSGGRLGDGSIISRALPTQVVGLETGVTVIAVSQDYTCAIQRGAAWCWGAGPNGELGHASINNATTPLRVSELREDVTAIATGDRHACAVRRGEAWCWGLGRNGRLGSDATGRSPPTTVSALGGGVTAIVTGLNHSCAIQEGTVKCWGQNLFDQLGDRELDEGQDNAPIFTAVPKEARGFTENVTMITSYAGGNHNCAIVNAAAWCWGNNNNSQLGVLLLEDRSNRKSAMPIQVDNLNSGVTAVSAGNLHSCAIQNRMAKCWGSNASARLGVNTIARSGTPRQVQGLTSDVTAISAGANFSCAIQNGIVKCWGGNQSGRLGADSGVVESSIPLQVIDPRVPDTPRLTLGMVDRNSIAVSWTAPSYDGGPDITAYTVTAFSDVNPDSTPISTPSTGRNATIMGLVPNTAYQITVAAVNRIGTGLQGALEAQTLPEQPLAPQLNSGSVSQTVNTITIEWAAPENEARAGITGYIVFLDSVPTTLTGTIPPPTSYTITGLRKDTSYRISVIALNSMGRGAHSAMLEVRTQAGPPPSAPQRLRLSGSNSVTTKSIAVSWDPPESDGGGEIRQYIVYWSSAGSAEISDSVTSLQTSFTIGSLSANTTYQITVAAMNRNMGERSSVREVQTLPLRPLAPELNSDSVSATTNSITIEWTAPTNESSARITGYIVYWGSVAGAVAETSESITVVGSSISHTITDLMPATTYQIAVAAMNRNIGERSSVREEQTVPLRPLAPELSSDGVSATINSITIEWTAPANEAGAGITGYVVSLDSAPTTLTGTIPLLTSYTITGLSGNTTYQIAVAAVNRIGTGPQSVLEVQTLPERPLAPELNSSSVSATINSITIEWTAPANEAGAGIIGYIVFLDSAPTTLTGTIPPPTSYTITDLMPETTYQIAVAAVNPFETGERSITLQRQTMARFLGPPTNLRVTKVTGTSIEIMWEQPMSNDVGDIKGYIVFYQLADTIGLPTTKSVTATSDIIRGLQGETTYQITVAAMNSDGLGPRSTTLMQQTAVSATSATQAIAAGGAHTCVIDNGAAKCWGLGSSGQLGHNATSDSNVPVSVYRLRAGVGAITAGRAHSCALQNSVANRTSVAKCWGAGGNGQLGTGSTESSSIPLNVRGLTQDVTMITAGNRHSCAIDEGAAKCWGAGGNGQLGNGNTELSSSPVLVNGLSAGVTAIAAGGSHSCAVHNGMAKCWGGGRAGQLGNLAQGRSTSTVAVQVDTLNDNITAVTAGLNHSCAIDEGAAKCWGANNENQLGFVTPGEAFTLAVGIVQQGGVGQGSITAVSAGDLHTCAIDEGAAKCWGEGLFLHRDQLNTDVTAIAAGREHTCAIEDAVVKCWGRDDDGRLGIGAVFRRVYRSPQTVTGLTNPGQVPEVLPPGMLLKPTVDTVMTKSFRVYWTAPTDELTPITEYIIYWRGNGAERSTRVNAGQRSYRFDNLQPGTEYQIAVAAVNDGGDGTRSEPPLDVRTVALAQAPANLRLLSMTANSITVNWDPPPMDVDVSIREYNVYWSLSFVENRGVTMSKTSTTNYRVSDLQSNTTYQIIVATDNLDSTETRSMALDVRTDARLPLAPAPPTTSGEVTGDSIPISWSLPPPRADGATITGYVVYWEAGNSTKRIPLYDNPSTRYTITGLMESTRYSITLAAVNRSGEGQVSGPLIVQTSSAQVPSAPQELRLSSGRNSVTTKSIAVSWDPPMSNGGSPILEYSIVWYEIDTMTMTRRTATVTVDEPNDYTIPSLTPNTNYQIEVTATNRIGPGPPARTPAIKTRSLAIRMKIKVLLEGALQ